MVMIHDFMPETLPCASREVLFATALLEIDLCGNNRTSAAAFVYCTVWPAGCSVCAFNPTDAIVCMYGSI